MRLEVYTALEILAVVLVAVAMALTLAHALELPGKLRLSKEQYLAVQPIYYPGFTFAGIAEPLGVLLLGGLTLALPAGTFEFWLMAGAFTALLIMHLCYWLLTHPVNNFWLKDVRLGGAGAGFFRFGSTGRTASIDRMGWTELRDRWEYSHVVRAGLGVVSLLLLVTAVSLR